MRRKFRRTTTSFVLALALVVGLNPAAALATDGMSSDGGIAPGTSSAVENSAPVNYGYIPDNTPAKSIHDGSEVKSGKFGVLAITDLPEKYDSREKGYVTPIRNQGSLGTCWAFATIGAIEASLLAHGQVNNKNDLDLSERHLIYFMYNAVADPLGNTAGDKTTMLAGNGNYLKMGGNEYMAAYSLATWQGVVEENVAPYNELLQYNNDTALEHIAIDDGLAYSQDNFHLRGMQRISMQDIDDVKRAITEYGAAVTGVCCEASSKYLTTGAGSQKYLYAYEKVAADHSVMLVGWDDTVSRNCFGSSEATRPTSDGAWLVKNSWGENWGDGGFFWVSYEDKCLTSGTEKATVFAMGDVDEFDNIYQYDGSARMASYGVNAGGGIANMFTATGPEMLKAVSFALNDVNVSYSIQVYLNPENSNDPTSGTPALPAPVQGVTSYTGYYTVDLPSEIPLSAGTSYAVVITLNRNAPTVYYCCDSSSSGVDLAFTNSVSPGQSFERLSAGSLWRDLAMKGASARIKAFTKNVNAGQDSQTDQSEGESGGKGESPQPIVQKTQKLTVAKAQLSKSVSAKKVKKAAKNTSRVVVKGAKTKLTYKKLSGSKRLTIGKTSGKIKVKKGTKKGKYKIKIRASAASVPNLYAGATKKFTVVVRVK